MRRENSAVRNTWRENLAKKAREVNGSEHMGDDFEKFVAEAEGFKFEVGDMVWGKVKSYPWWPGQIFDEEWADPSVYKSKKEGHVLVAFFGDSSYGWFDPMELIPFDSHYVEKSKQSSALAFLVAVEDAEHEASRRAALGLVCQCRNLLTFHRISLHGFCTVDVEGYESSGVYSMMQMKSARHGFQPAVTLSFLRQLALVPDKSFQRNVDWIKNVAMVGVYRKAVFEGTDETCILASGAQSEHLTDSTMDLAQQEEVPSQVHLNRSIEISEAVGQTKKFVSPVGHTAQPNGKTFISKVKDESDVIETLNFVQGKGSLCTLYERESIMAAGECSQGRSEVISTNTIIPGCQKTLLRSMVKIENSDEDDNARVIGSLDSPSEAVWGELFMADGECMQGRSEAISKNADVPGCQKTLLRSMVKIENSDEGENVHVIGSLVPPLEAVLPENSFDNAGHFGDVQQEGLCTTSYGMEVLDLITTEVVHRQLIVDLLALALDPHHGVEQNTSGIVQHFFLLFRSIVFKNSIAASPSVEEDLVEGKFKPTDIPVSTVSVDSVWSSRARGPPFDSIPPKKRLKLDDFVMTHQQRNIYDIGEEISLRVQENLYQSMSLAVEERAEDQNHVKSQSINQEKIGAKNVANQIKDAAEKSKTWIASAERTILLVSFSPKSAAPCVSVSELKAKFARFGPLDFPATYVCQKTPSCFVAFKCKSDALAAYDYAIQNNSLFGNANISYQLETLETQPSKSHISGNQHVNQTHEKDMLPTMTTGGSIKRGIQLKSCLKKPLVHKAGCSTPKQALSVKFVLNEDEGSKREQLVVKSNRDYSNCNYPCDSISPCSATFQLGSNQNLQQSVLKPLPALPNEILNVTGNHLVNNFVDICNAQSYEAAGMNTTSTPRQSVDISNQMMSNLIRCSEIINNLKSALGYVPLHL